MRPFIKVIPPGAQDLGQAPLRSIPIARDGLRGNDLRSFIKRAGHPLAEQVRRMEKQAGEELIHLIALGATEFSGCFFQGAPVQTESGLKPIEEVVVGDRVLTHQNRYRPVTHTFKQPFSGDRVTLTVSGLPDRIVSTANHPFWVVRRSDFGVYDRCTCWLEPRGLTKIQAVDRVVADKAQFVDASTLQKGDYLIVPTNPTLSGVETLKPEDAYLMGVYLAEGCVARSYRPKRIDDQPDRMILTVSTNDRGVLDRIHRDTGRHVGLQPSLTSDKGLRATISGRAVSLQCKRLFGNHSTRKRISPQIFMQSREWRLNFLAGYFDGDGCVTNSPGKARYQGTLRGSTASLNLALDLQRLLAGLGVPSKVTRLTNKQSNGCFGSKDHTIFEVSVGSAYSEVVLEQCVRLKYPQGLPKRNKQSHGQCGSDYLLLPVVDTLTEPVEDEIKYNLEVQDDNTFTTYTISHNSNRNGDGFRCLPLQKYHPTFVKHARWYRNHQNQDPSRSYGVVKLSYYHPEMHRVELIVGLNGTPQAAKRNGGLVADREMAKLANDQDIAVSMSCRVPKDVCSSCHNQARSRDEYCTEATCPHGGLRDHITKVAEDGHVLHADNPIFTFFDISDVGRGADRVAFVLGRVKSAAGLRPGGAALAEMLQVGCPDEVALLDCPSTLRPSLTALYKLALADRQAGQDPYATLADPSHRGLTLFSGLPAKEGSLPALGPKLWSALAQRQVLLPPVPWLALQGQVKAAQSVQRLLPGGYQRLLGRPDLETCLEGNPYRVSDGPGQSPGPAEQAWTAKAAGHYSLDRSALRGRIHLAVLRERAVPAWRTKSAHLESCLDQASVQNARRLAEAYTLYQVGFLAAQEGLTQSPLAAGQKAAAATGEGERMAFLAAALTRLQSLEAR